MNALPPLHSHPMLLVDKHKRQYYQTGNYLSFWATDTINRALKKQDAKNDYVLLLTYMLDAISNLPSFPPMNGPPTKQNPLMPSLLSKEGFAGSVPLLLLEQILSVDSNGNKIDRFVTAREWTVNDVDYFICTLSKTKFLNRVQSIVSALRKVVGVNHVVQEPPRSNLYVDPKRPVWIVDVEISGVATKLSFVQSLQADMHETVEHFDISVVKVVYDCRIEMIHASYPVVKDIVLGRAEVRDFHVARNAPTWFEVSQISSTLKRMTKYGERGYRFNHYPRMIPGCQNDH